MYIYIYIYIYIRTMTRKKNVLVVGRSCAKPTVHRERHIIEKQYRAGIKYQYLS
jgi:hypothetical protein